MEYFSHPENYSQNHPDFIKAISVKSKDVNVINYEQEIAMMKRAMTQSQRMTVLPEQKQVVIDTVGGSGKGSKITISVSDNTTSGGSRVKYVADMKLGPLGFMASGAARGEMEKVANEDQKNLDALA